MSRIRLFRLQPDEMNSVASQSSSSGWDGGSPWRPKFSGVATRPRPKSCCQAALTATRAERGLAGSTSQRARSCRSGSPAPSRPRSGGRNAGVPGRTPSPGVRKSPRTWTNVGLGLGAFATVKAFELGGGGRLFASISLSKTAAFRRPYSGSIERKYRPIWLAWSAVRDSARTARAAAISGGMAPRSTVRSQAACLAGRTVFT